MQETEKLYTKEEADAYCDLVEQIKEGEFRLIIHLLTKLEVVAKYRDVCELGRVEYRIALKRGEGRDASFCEIVASTGDFYSFDVGDEVYTRSTIEHEYDASDLANKLSYLAAEDAEEMLNQSMKRRMISPGVMMALMIEAAQIKDGRGE